MMTKIYFSKIINGSVQKNYFLKDTNFYIIYNKKMRKIDAIITWNK